MSTLRHRLIAYFTAACINLAIVGGTHLPSYAARPAIVRLREHGRSPIGFDRGEIVGGSAVAVQDGHCEPDWFCAN